MKYIRSSKCSTKFSNAGKISSLGIVLAEYSRVVNVFIDKFWLVTPSKSELLKPVVDSVFPTWLSARLRKVAAREAIDLIKSTQKRNGKKAKKPSHSGKEMHVSSTIADLQPSKNTKHFDCWLRLTSIGSKVKINIPIKLHKHFNLLYAKGKRLNSYIITRDYVQFCFEIETKKKKKTGKAVGIDTGIKALASLSDGNQFGTDIESYLDLIKRCEQGSKGQKKARRALRQRIDEVVKEIFQQPFGLVVVERLKNLNKGTKLKRRLSKSMRRTLGSWTYRYFLDRIQRECEVRRSTFRSINPRYTSQECPRCSHTERSNRRGIYFSCQSCGYSGNADVTAAKNILNRLLLGAYGPQYKAYDVSYFV